MRRAVAAVIVAAVVLAGCGADEPAPGPGPPAAAQKPIRIGTKNFTEQFILGELYSQALRAKGFKVELKSNIGSTEITHRALTAGSLDMYAEYLGVLLSEIAKLRDRPKSTEAVYKLAKLFEERKNYTLLQMTPFSDANALAVKPAYARRHKLRSIDDLNRLDRPQVAAPPEFRGRYEGMRGLRERYGLRNLRLRTLKEGENRYAVLDSGKVEVALAFTSEGQLLSDRYQLLADPRRVFADGHVAPIIDADVLKAHGPRLAAAIDAVSATLSTAAMRRMNKAVDLDGREAAEVAQEFLRSQGLVG